MHLLPLPHRHDAHWPQAQHPCILQHFDAFLERVNGKRVAVFLDYDGAQGAAAAAATAAALQRRSTASSQNQGQRGAAACWVAVRCRKAHSNSSTHVLLTRRAAAPWTCSAGTLTPIVNNPDDAILSPQVLAAAAVAAAGAAACTPAAVAAAARFRRKLRCAPASTPRALTHMPPLLTRPADARHRAAGGAPVSDGHHQRPRAGQGRGLCAAA